MTEDMNIERVDFFQDMPDDTHIEEDDGFYCEGKYITYQDIAEPSPPDFWDLTKDLSSPKMQEVSNSRLEELSVSKERFQLSMQDQNQEFADEFMQPTEQSYLFNSTHMDLEFKMHFESNFQEEIEEEEVYQTDRKGKILELNPGNSTATDHRTTYADSHLGLSTSASGHSNINVQVFSTEESLQTSEDTHISETQGFRLIARCQFSEIVIYYDVIGNEIAFDARHFDLSNNLQNYNYGELWIENDNGLSEQIYGGPLASSNLYRLVHQNSLNTFTALKELKKMGEESKPLNYMNSNSFKNEKLEEALKTPSLKCRKFYIDQSNQDIIAPLKKKLTAEHIARFFLKPSRKDALEYEESAVFLSTRVSLLQPHILTYSSQIHTLTGMFHALIAIKDFDIIMKKMVKLADTKIGTIRGLLNSA